MVHDKCVERWVHGGNNGCDGQIGIATIAQSEVIRNSDDFDAVREIFVSLATNIFLKGGRRSATTVNLRESEPNIIKSLRDSYSYDGINCVGLTSLSKREANNIASVKVAT